MVEGVACHRPRRCGAWSEGARRGQGVRRFYVTHGGWVRFARMNRAVWGGALDSHGSKLVWGERQLIREADGEEKTSCER